MAKNGTETVSVSLPGTIIDLTDKVAGIQDLNRSKLVERALKEYFLHHAVELVGMGHADFWDEVYRKVFNKS